MLTRFAPSPTGFLHIGNVRTALICFLYARKEGGKFMLRIDDTDSERSKQEYIDAIYADLEWLGISPDLTARQSERFDKYDQAVAKLKDAGRLYPCYETAEELEFKRKMQLGRGQPPVYDRASLKLTDQDRVKFEQEGKKPHWRFKLEDQQVIWQDEIRGEIKISPATMSDPILIRENGAYTYMLPSTVDDIDFSVTHVLRGEDHISNTAIQIQIFEALGGKAPNFAHNSLIKSKEGKLSKRKGDGAIADLKQLGIQPIALNTFLAKIGTSESVQLKETLEQLIEEFDISKFSKSPTQYSEQDLLRLNTQAIHNSSYDAIKSQLPDHIDKSFWEVVKPNLESVNDAETWWNICHEEVKPEFESEDDRKFVSSLASIFPDGEVDDSTWDKWTTAIKLSTDRKGKQLFMPIRIALTGMKHGPELKNILPLIGRQKILNRLEV
jgi:glutamyl-tRNA synthetase